MKRRPRVRPPLPPQGKTERPPVRLRPRRDDVELGLDLLAREADPVLVGEPAEVRREGAAAADLPAKRLREVEGELQVEIGRRTIRTRFGVLPNFSGWNIG